MRYQYIRKRGKFGLSKVTLSGKHFSDREGIYKAYIEMLKQWEGEVEN